MENKITVQPNYETHGNFFSLEPTRQIALLSDSEPIENCSAKEILAYLELKHLKDSRYSFEVISIIAHQGLIKLKCRSCGMEFILPVEELKTSRSGCIHWEDGDDFKDRVLEICSLNKVIKDFKLEDTLKMIKQERKSDGFEITFDFAGFEATLPLKKAYTFIYKVYREVEDSKLAHSNKVKDLLDDFNGETVSTIAISIGGVPAFIVQGGEKLFMQKLRTAMQTGNEKTCYFKKDWEAQKAEYITDRETKAVTEDDIITQLRTLVTEFNLDDVLKIKKMKDTKERDTILCEHLGLEFEVKIKEAYTKICQMHEYILTHPEWINRFVRKETKPQ